MYGERTVLSMTLRDEFEAAVSDRDEFCSNSDSEAGTTRKWNKVKERSVMDRANNASGVDTGFYIATL